MDAPTTDPLVLAPGEGAQLNVIGDNQVIKLTGEQTGGLLSFIENENMPGTTVPLHWHDNDDETFYVLEGRVEFTVGDGRFLATEGTTVFGPRRVPHAWTVVGDRPARMLLLLTPGGGDRMFAELAAECGDRCEAKMPPFETIAAICARHGVHFVPPPAK